MEANVGPEDDLLILLKSRMAKQQEAVTRKEKRPFSSARKRQDLLVAKDTYKADLLAQEDMYRNGAKKAKERAKASR